MHIDGFTQDLVTHAHELPELIKPVTHDKFLTRNAKKVDPQTPVISCTHPLNFAALGGFPGLLEKGESIFEHDGRVKEEYLKVPDEDSPDTEPDSKVPQVSNGDHWPWWTYPACAAVVLLAAAAAMVLP